MSSQLDYVSWGYRFMWLDSPPGALVLILEKLSLVFRFFTGLLIADLKRLSYTSLPVWIQSTTSNGSRVVSFVLGESPPQDDWTPCCRVNQVSRPLWLSPSWETWCVRWQLFNCIHHSTALTDRQYWKLGHVGSSNILLCMLGYLECLDIIHSFNY